MAIFRRDNPPTPQRRPEARPANERPAPKAAAQKGTTGARQERAAAGGTNVTLVARGSHFVGKISGPAEVVIEGEVEGEVVLDGHAQIGSHGKVRGNVVVKSARIAGQVVGNVRGHEVVELTATGKLEGDVSAPRVIIAEGAFFRGNIEMTGKKPGAPAAPGEKGGSPEAGRAEGGGGTPPGGPAGGAKESERSASAAGGPATHRPQTRAGS